MEKNVPTLYYTQTHSCTTPKASLRNIELTVHMSAMSQRGAQKSLACFTECSASDLERKESYRKDNQPGAERAFEDYIARRNHCFEWRCSTAQMNLGSFSLQRTEHALGDFLLRVHCPRLHPRFPARDSMPLLDMPQPQHRLTTRAAESVLREM